MPPAKRSIILDVARSRDSHVYARRSVFVRRARCANRAACASVCGLEALQMSAPPIPDLARENAYLRKRNAQLQEDVLALSAEAERLRQIVERLHGRIGTRPPNPLSGGQ